MNHRHSTIGGQINGIVNEIHEINIRATWKAYVGLASRPGRGEGIPSSRPNLEGSPPRGQTKLVKCSNS